MIVSFLIQKGGVGKSTLSINAADYLHRQGHSVLLIDADEQGTSSDWVARRDEPSFPVIALSRENMAKEIMGHAMNYDYVVIDGPPRAQKISRAIIIASDLVVMPIEPSGASDWASESTIAQVREALDYKPDLKSCFLVSRMIANTVIGKAIREHVAEYNIPILQRCIVNRVPYAEALTLGQSIFEHAPNSEAANDITAMMQEIGAFYHDQTDHKAKTQIDSAAHG